MPAVVQEPDPVVNGTANGSGTNGTATNYSRPHTPRNPSLSGLALTEYSANPSPPRAGADKQAQIQKIVPDELLLPNGHPDVSYL
jgi:threonine dehydratase